MQAQWWLGRVRGRDRWKRECTIELTVEPSDTGDRALPADCFRDEQ